MDAAFAAQLGEGAPPLLWSQPQSLSSGMRCSTVAMGRRGLEFGFLDRDAAVASTAVLRSSGELGTAMSHR